MKCSKLTGPSSAIDRSAKQVGMTPRPLRSVCIRIGPDQLNARPLNIVIVSPGRLCADSGLISDCRFVGLARASRVLQSSLLLGNFRNRVTNLGKRPSIITLRSTDCGPPLFVRQSSRVGGLQVVDIVVKTIGATQTSWTLTCRIRKSARPQTTSGIFQHLSDPRTRCRRHN